ncbi:molybdopterin converting factor subunit 1 [Roseateles oligotrophus]|uniref:Molybdopterin synthase sulfur carrier subunit n=1 Tax=Roseateles oligotrophus TaxID=1769250 RepID=A0ABT2Y9B1_9BURK|nr:molybdopterin converting factor subunit 1 [Roseateles oligotrophus]MCV2366886.1 molybdopterin converting factor subunit 1 [Roseateles oligotrophus]
MTIRLKFFASLRERLGANEALTLPAGTTVAGLRDLLLARSDAHAELLARGRAVRCAVNQQLCAEDAVIGDGAEVAFFPPVTGG